MIKEAIQAALDELAQAPIDDTLEVLARMGAAEAILKRALTKPEWRRMTSAPYDGTPVLIKYLEHHTKKYHYFVGRYIASRIGTGRSDSTRWSCDFSGEWFGEFDSMIGWQPLPE